MFDFIEKGIIQKNPSLAIIFDNDIKTILELENSFDDTPFFASAAELLKHHKEVNRIRIKLGKKPFKLNKETGEIIWPK